MKRAVLLLTAAVIALPGPALAWGDTGHRMVGRLAAQAFPATLPAFLRTSAAVNRIEELAREPDRWRKAGEPHDTERDSAHFMDLDDEGKAFSGDTLANLPLKRSAYEGRLAAAHSNSFKAGWLPYAIDDGWQQLVKDFAMWRIEKAALAREHNKTRKAWYAWDLRLREDLIVRDLGVWAHYVGDASQPMHLSIHYNGWGPFPNPAGYTQEHIHVGWEGAWVSANVKREAVRAAMTPYKACASPIQACVAAYLNNSREQVETIYAIEKRGSLKTPSPEAIAFTTGRIAAGASMLRDMSVDAWTASEGVTVGFDNLTVQDVRSGKTDAWKTLHGDG